MTPTWKAFTSSKIDYYCLLMKKKPPSPIESNWLFPDNAEVGGTHEWAFQQIFYYLEKPCFVNISMESQWIFILKTSRNGLEVDRLDGWWAWFWEAEGFLWLTDRQMYRQTFAILESLSLLKNHPKYLTLPHLSDTHLSYIFNFKKVDTCPPTFPLCNADINMNF